MSKYLDTETLYRYYTAHPSVCTDSRRIEEGDLFFALVGPSFDGNDYALKALSLGAAYAVVSRPELASQDPRLLLVEDTLTALQKLANHHRRVLGTQLIAITGTNGKTTTKELTLAALSKAYMVMATEGNLNNHIGVPLTLLKLRPEHELGIIEMGASSRGEIALLCEIAEPNIGLITNIGKAHLEGFGSQMGILLAKSELPQYLEQHGGKFILNSDDPLLQEHWGKSAYCAYSLLHSADIEGSIISDQPLRVELTHKTQHAIVESQLAGRYNAPNILAATALALTAKAPLEQIAEGISSYKPSNNRSQLITIQGNRTIIMDAYNANPSSMLAALENLLHQPQVRKYALIGDMLELGEASREEHKKVIDWLEQHPDIEARLCGREFGRVVRGDLLHADDIIGFNTIMRDHPLTEQSVTLIKGSRGIALEQTLPVIKEYIK